MTTASGSRARTYSVAAHNAPGGAGSIVSHESVIAFDGSSMTGDTLPGPADLLAASLAACILKNVERFSGILPFRYERARVQVEVDREEPPPQIVAARYALYLVTDEPPSRVDLLHRNIVQFGTVTNTLAAACPVTGEVIIEEDIAPVC